MYQPAIFAETDRATIATFLDAHPLATLVLVVDGRAHVDHMPFMRLGAITPGEPLIAHVSKSNPTWKLVGDSIEAVLVFSGASAYVSPSLYPSKQVTHEVVPTWNYASVHLRGTLQTVQDRDGRRCGDGGQPPALTPRSKDKTWIFLRCSKHRCRSGFTSPRSCPLSCSAAG